MDTTTAPNLNYVFYLKKPLQTVAAPNTVDITVSSTVAKMKDQKTIPILVIAVLQNTEMNTNNVIQHLLLFISTDTEIRILYSPTLEL